MGYIHLSPDFLNCYLLGAIIFRTCLKITIRLIWGKFAPVLRYFFHQIARIWLQKMPCPEQNLPPTNS